MTDPDVEPAPAGLRTEDAPRARSAGVVIAATLGGAAVAALATVIRWWFAPFVVGLALGGLAAARGISSRTAILSAVGATLAGWSVPLIGRSIAGEPVLATAGFTAALIGLPPHGWMIVVATLVIAVAQGVLGVWLSRSVGALVRLARHTGVGGFTREPGDRPTGG